MTILASLESPAATAGTYVVDDDAARLDLDVIHGFLRTAYWSPGVPREVVERAIANSLCFGLYAPDSRQVGFARLVTDRATFAWLADVFVLDSERGRGLGRFLVSTTLNHPDVAAVRRIMLATADAHDLYRSYGFSDLEVPSRYLAVVRSPAELYGKAGE
ncbi:GNAT family N-acetyltransferase [Kribbella deserti]|uniref:GNAT family N-acetyltransferase n=1 Tax=Kribbella deserti TaxID=1926257 RepID=A0ABV6QW08_9ACTN